jgi:hypothetical protein
MAKLDESGVETTAVAQQRHGQHHHLSWPSQEDRIRTVFGLPADSPLPRVNEETLTRYHIHLACKLVLPFEALYCPTSGEMRQLIHYVHVTDMIDPRHSRPSTLHHGLSCKAVNAKNVLDLPLSELGVREENPNCELLDDYSYWFVNWR